MALNPNTTAANIAAAVTGAVPPAGTPISPSQLTAIWTQIITALYNDLKSDGDILPGTFKDGNNVPITGIGKID